MSQLAPPPVGGRHSQAQPHPGRPGSGGPTPPRHRRLLSSLLVAVLAAVAAVAGLAVADRDQADASPAVDTSTAASASASASGSAVSTAAGATASSGATAASTSSSATASTAGPPGSSQTWTEVFGDEFDGTSIDSTKWRVNRYGGTQDDAPFNPSQEGAYYSPANVGVADGSAWLQIQPDPSTIDGAQYAYSSGMLSSEGNFQMQDGDYIETRVWLPAGDGLWPAIWTVPDDRWPPEVDVVEMFGTSVSNTLHFIYHYPTTTGASGDVSTGTYGAAGVDYRDSWHTFGMLRSQGRIVPYVDGVAYPEAGVTAGADALPQSIILNLAMYAGKNPVAGTRMLVDWVHVWRPVSG